jgi:hypothetical protein
LPSLAVVFHNYTFGYLIFINILKVSVFSEEVIARDIEEFEKQKHLLNTPVQVNARILLVESICIP